MGIKLDSAFRDLFSTPGKWLTILLLAVCILVPIVGPMVLSGYLIRRFASVRRGFPATDFNLDCLGEYLQIGLWPFLCSLVVSLAAIPLFLLCYSPMALIMMDPESGMTIAIAILLMLLLFAMASVLLALILYPVMLRSGLQMKFGAGFSLEFIRDFIKRVGGQVILWAVILGAISIPLYLLGYLALFVGVYPVAAALYFVGYHLMFQMYDLYRERGGGEIAVADYIYSSVPVVPPEVPPTLPGGEA